MEHLLTYLILIPLIGAGLILTLLQGEEAIVASRAKLIALLVSTVTFLISLALWFGFDREQTGFQFVHAIPWLTLGDITLQYKVGVDGISVLLVLLSTLLMPLVFLSSWDSIKTRVRAYMAAFLVLESLMIGTFVALDLFLFYLFFEAVLIPMFLIIGVWGGQDRVYAAYKFFLYTLLGSVLMLIAMLTMTWLAGTTDIEALLADSSAFAQTQTFLWLAFFASFAVKMPMWPVHTWLPDAHVQAPTGGSVILAGVLLKMGGYGFLRFSLPMFPEASQAFAPFIFVLSIIALIYTSLVALAQKDMKKLIAYSSVAHMGFVTAGIFAFNAQGIEGALMQMLAHGVVSGALFLAVGVVYDRLHTRDIDAYGGVAKVMPGFALVFMIFMLASVGLPGTGSFVAEFVTLLGLFKANLPVGVLMTTGLILGATYMLWLYRKVIFGQLEKEAVKALKDMNLREKATFVPLIILVFWMGVYPKPFFDFMHRTVADLSAPYTPPQEQAGPRAYGLAEAPESQQLESQQLETRQLEARQLEVRQNDTPQTQADPGGETT